MMEMTAATDIYSSKSESLKLEQSILVASSTGYQGRPSEATIDIRNHVVFEHPVEAKMLQGALNANQLEVVDSGDDVRIDSPAGRRAWLATHERRGAVPKNKL